MDDISFSDDDVLELLEKMCDGLKAYFPSNYLFDRDTLNRINELKEKKRIQDNRNEILKEL